MARVRIVPVDDSELTAERLEFSLWRRFDGLTIEKQTVSLWYMQLPESYNWTSEDAEYMEKLAHVFELLAGWN